MSAPLEKEVATVASPQTPTRPNAARLPVPKIPLEGDPMSLVSTPREDFDPTSHPASPFYSHPTTKTSFEQLKCASTAGFSAYDTDVEAGSKRPSHEDLTPQSTSLQKDCTVWPQRQTLLMQHKQRKRQRACYPWNVLSKKQKLAAKLATLLLIIAIGVGIGVGVSRAVGGTWYKSANQQGQVGTPSN